MALRNLGIDHEVVAIAEIDKFAIDSYEAIHGEVNNLGDISKVKVEDIPDHDLFTYGFPCQDISVAGKGEGFSKDSGTRSSLLWETNRVIENKRPKYLLMENVKNLVSKKFKDDYLEWLEHLEELGYTNYWEVLNAKDYGVPQNRDRVFCVSILGEHKPYEFPKKEELLLRLKDVLLPEVPEKFYLSKEKVDKLMATIPEDKMKELLEKDLQVVGNTTPNEHKGKNVYLDEGVSPTLTATNNKHVKQVAQQVVEEPTIKQIGNTTSNPKRDNPQTGRTYDPDGLSPTLNTMQGGNLQPQVLEKYPIVNNTEKGYVLADEYDGIDINYLDSKTRRGRVQKGISGTITTKEDKGVIIGASRGRNPENTSDRTVGAPTEQRLELNEQGTTNTLTTVQKDNYVFELSEFKIRKLVPQECWRLMGCSDEDFFKAESVNSNTQLYKQAGNAIVVDVLEKIFANLFEEER
jgi:DNA (cytosine-5)-methyltransferase 1